MTDQARKRAEEYFVREWDVIDLMSRDYIIDSHIDGQKVGRASALEEIGKVEDVAGLVNKFLSWPLPQSVCSDSCVTNSSYGYSRIGTNLLNATEAEIMIRHLFSGHLLEIATLRAHLEKCKEQRNRITTAMHNEDFRELDRNAKTQIANFDAELEALK